MSLWCTSCLSVRPQQRDSRLTSSVQNTNAADVKQCAASAVCFARRDLLRWKDYKMDSSLTDWNKREVIHLFLRWLDFFHQHEEWRPERGFHNIQHKCFHPVKAESQNWLRFCCECKSAEAQIEIICAACYWNVIIVKVSCWWDTFYCHFTSSVRFLSLLKVASILSADIWIDSIIAQQSRLAGLSLCKFFSNFCGQNPKYVTSLFAWAEIQTHSPHISHFMRETLFHIAVTKQ